MLERKPTYTFLNRKYSMYPTPSSGCWGFFLNIPGLRNKTLIDPGFTELCGAWPCWMALGSHRFWVLPYNFGSTSASIFTANCWLSFHFADLPAFRCFYLGLFKRATLRKPLATVFLLLFSASFPLAQVIYWILPRTGIMGIGRVQSHETPHSEGPTLGSVFCCSCLDTLSNFVFEFVCYK